MEIVRPATRDEIILDVAYAEVASARWFGAYALHLGDRAKTLAHLPLADWNASDRDAARSVAAALREPVLGPILATHSQLFLASVRSGELAQVRLMNLPQFQRFAPTGMLSEFVKNLDAGKPMPDDGFANSFRAVRPTFDPARMRGRPILVAEKREGPFIEAEGLTRMSCLLSMEAAGAAVPESIQVFLGISPDLGRWPFFRYPALAGRS